MTNLFVARSNEPEDYWRSIILYGRNVQSYKFALASALLELKPRSGTLYQTLGVLTDTEDIVIRAAYRALAQKYHPDKWQGDPSEANRLMRLSNSANPYVPCTAMPVLVVNQLFIVSS